ncbi:MAG: hypothetical protein F3740_06875 [Nitrospinae bacterium]|nr:hypothetical protein [Nitrospinota bacterium]
MKIIAILITTLFLSSNAYAEINWAKRYFEQAVDHHLTGNNDASIKAFKKSLRHNNKDATTHYYLALIYDLKNMGANAITHMLKAEKIFAQEGRDYWEGRSRKMIEQYYNFYRYSKEEFEKEY